MRAESPGGGAGALRWFRLALAAIAVATVVAMIVMWPGDAPDLLGEGIGAATERAEVDSVLDESCPPPQPGACRSVTAELRTGPDTGTVVTLALGDTAIAPEIEVGDSIRLSRAAGAPEGALPSASPGYNFVDFERRAPMLWLALGFAALVVIFGRTRGALSLLGLAASLLVIAVFVVPAILDGSAPLAVAVVGSMAVMMLTISLAHGLGPKSVAAMLGTTLSLSLVALLGLAFVDLTHLTGLASEESTILQVGGADISLTGLVLAGIVIAALGVLDDVTVSQASTVLALRRANSGLRFSELYRRAIDVGRDHVTATVNTLVLAYVGSSLPVLLIFGSGEIGFLDAINLEIVAQEVVATLVGSIGLIAAVPITTALAAALARGVPIEALDEEPAHAH